jgi:hypothetical protein
MNISIERRKLFLVNEIQKIRHHLDHPEEKIAGSFEPAITMKRFADDLKIFEKELIELDSRT